jgi:hypothetical protein
MAKGNIEVNGFRLMKGSVPVQKGDVYQSFREEDYMILGGYPPAHEGSTGRVNVYNVEDGTECQFFPGVFDMKWEKIK